MRLDERDIALCLDKRSRQLWAEKHLEMAPSPEEAAWTKWYNYLHDQVEERLRVEKPDRVDLTPSSPEDLIAQNIRNG